MPKYSKSIDEIIKILNNNSYNVLAIYPFGSYVYKTYTENSDHDYVVVIDKHDEHFSQISKENININLYTESYFQHKLNNHDIDAIEIFSTIPLIDNGYEMNFEMNLEKLRRSICEKSSHSFVKAKKKIILEHEDSYIGIKSLFHALRIVIFGIQIAQEGKITNFHEANYIWDEIKNSKHNWDYLKKTWKPELNKLLTQFRKIAQKY